MRRWVYLFCLLPLFFIGCAKQEEVSDKNQLMEIAGADGGIIRQITDNTLIAEITEKEMAEFMDWEYPDELPPQARKLYTYTVYEEVTEPLYLKDGRPWISVTDSVLYEDGEDYYMAENGEVIRLPRATGGYMEELAAEEGTIQDRKTIFASWNTGVILNPEEVEDIQERAEGVITDGIEDAAAQLPFSDIETFDYKGVAAVSKYQKFEKTDDSGNVLYSTSDLDTIVDILNGMRINQWEEVNAAPEGAVRVCTLIRYAHPKKKPGKDLEVQERLVLYRADEDYYISSEIPGIMESQEKTQMYFYRLPSGTGEYLEGLRAE